MSGAALPDRLAARSHNRALETVDACSTSIARTSRVLAMLTSARFDVRVVVARQAASLDVCLEIVASPSGAGTCKLFVLGFPDVLRSLLTLDAHRTAAALAH